MTEQGGYMKGTELIAVDKLKPAVVFTEVGLGKILDEIKKKVAEFEPDLSTAGSRKEIASMARKVSSSKAFLDNMRKDLNADAKKEIDIRNGVWNPLKAALDELRDKTRKPLTDFEEAEEKAEGERINGIQKQLDLLKVINIPETTSGIETLIERLKAMSIQPEVYFEFKAEADAILEDKLSDATTALERRIRMDKEEAEQKAESERLAAERAEIEKDRKEQEAAAAKIKAEQDKINEANRKIEAEKAEIERVKREAQEKKSREEFEQQAKIQAEIDTQAEVKRKEAEKAEWDKAETAEKERLEALKPDLEKLTAFAQFLEQGITFPKVNSKEASYILEMAKIKLKYVVSFILEDANKM